MATLTMASRHPLPPFTHESAIRKVRLAEDVWNTRDPGKVALAYTIDSRWRNRSEFINGRNEIIAFLSRKWAKELNYRLIKEPISLKSPDIYRPLFWGGLWGIPLGLLLDAAWPHLYLIGFLYFLAPVLALFLIFLPKSGAGYFGLQQGGPMFTVYLLLVNLPFGIITALVARAIIGTHL